MLTDSDGAGGLACTQRWRSFVDLLDETGSSLDMGYITNVEEIRKDTHLKSASYASISKAYFLESSMREKERAACRAALWTV
jgi:hypothetical protein